MVTAILVDSKIETGKRLVQELDKAQLPVPAAFWFYQAEPGRWRLMIASRLVDSEGPKSVYTRIQSIIHASGLSEDIRLDEISVVSPKDSLVKSLGTVLHTGPHISGIRFSQNTINNKFIEDAYIYRMDGD